KQVRDVLHVSDAVAAYRMLRDESGRVKGEAFNLGGGPGNAVSLTTVLQQIGVLCHRRPQLSFDDWRQGDQPYFVADTSKLRDRLGWKAKVGWKAGLADLASWLREHRGLGTSEPQRQRARA